MPAIVIELLQTHLATSCLAQMFGQQVWPQPCLNAAAQPRPEPTTITLSCPVVCMHAWHHTLRSHQVVLLVGLAGAGAAAAAAAGRAAAKAGA